MPVVFKKQSLSLCQDVKKAIKAAGVQAADVAVAAVNGPKMTVISGRKEAVQKVGRFVGGWISWSWQPLRIPLLLPAERVDV